MSDSPPPSRRIVGLDLARAFAIFGMVVVNFKIVMGAESQGPDWLVRVAGFLDGRAAATFVVLAGVGISLLTRSGRVSGSQERLAYDRARLLRRASFLFLIGLLYTPIWPADILHFYGVYIAVAAFLIAWPTRRVLTAAGALVAAFPVLLLMLDYDRGWDWSTLTYHGFWAPDGMLRHLFFNGFHPVVPWLAFVLIGMAVGRMDLRRPSTRVRLIGGGVAAALLAESLSAWLVPALTDSLGSELAEAMFGTAPMPPMPLYIVAGSGVACAVIGVCVAVGDRFAGKGWLSPLVSTGQLAFTLYIGHVIVGMGVLEAMGRLEDRTLPFSLGYSGVFCVGSVLFAHLWKRRFRHGPIEALFRRVADPARPPPG